LQRILTSIEDVFGIGHAFGIRHVLSSVGHFDCIRMVVDREVFNAIQFGLIELVAI
jgi:hypothetical protein